MGAEFEANETKRNYMKETEDVIELDVTDGFQTLKDSKNLNEVTNEQIKKKGRRQARYYTDGKPQLAKTCGRFGKTETNKKLNVLH